MLESIPAKQLAKGYNISGNRGDVFSDECHIAPPGFSGRTLCDIPMLYNNYATRDMEVKCQECLERYANLKL